MWVPEAVQGREMTAFTTCRPEVERAGAKYIDKICTWKEIWYPVTPGRICPGS